MKWYFTNRGVKGWLPSENAYQLFDDESQYFEYFREFEE